MVYHRFSYIFSEESDGLPLIVQSFDRSLMLYHRFSYLFSKESHGLP